jgi:calcineurin-like phosphoesterase family protein
MPNTWFIADFHLGHANIIRYCNRPFATVEEMDQAIVERLNASVKRDDVLYFLGDFCMGNPTRVRAYRRRIHCKKIFAVPGNHDKQASKLKEEFSWLDNLAEVSIHGQSIVLCHYALRTRNRSNRGLWQLYGHSHGRLPEAPNSFSMDVGVDTHNFRLWHYDEIADIMTKKAEAREVTNRS